MSLFHKVVALARDRLIKEGSDWSSRDQMIFWPNSRSTRSYISYSVAAWLCSRQLSCDCALAKLAVIAINAIRHSPVLLSFCSKAPHSSLTETEIFESFWHFYSLSFSLFLSSFNLMWSAHWCIQKNWMMFQHDARSVLTKFLLTANAKKAFLVSLGSCFSSGSRGLLQLDWLRLCMSETCEGHKTSYNT